MYKVWNCGSGVPQDGQFLTLGPWPSREAFVWYLLLCCTSSIEIKTRFFRVFAVLSILGLAAASDPFLQVGLAKLLHRIWNILTENPQKELLQRKKKQFAREHGRNYKSGAEVHLRREIFNENYKSMMEHNARSAGQLHPILFLLLVKLHFPAIFSSFFSMIDLHHKVWGGSGDLD